MKKKVEKGKYYESVLSGRLSY